MLNQSKVLAGLISISILAAGCDRPTNPPSGSSFQKASASAGIDPLSIALVPHEGAAQRDTEIREAQQQVRVGRNRDKSLEKLGWLFVDKARESFDPGYYKLAEACAAVLETDSPGCAQGLLLRGHVLENLHQFKDAEPIARKLIATRGLAFDYALLGDALMEQGRLNEAVPAYQTMMDLRPDLHAYSRAAHLRWLKGDLEGATQLMQLAVRAGSSQDAEASAWVCVRLALYQFEAGDNAMAEHSYNLALAYCPDYPPALLLRGRMLLAKNDPTGAVEKLLVAARANPLPEYEWTLAEALRAAGRIHEATDVESRIRREGTAADPRTFSLFLATKRDQTGTAVQLARAELLQREDVFTHDALAWALSADGHADEASQEMSRACAEGTDDGRLYFHAAAIAANSGRESEARQWLRKASPRQQLLLPSEREQLHAIAMKLAGSGSASLASADARTLSIPQN